MKLAVNLDSYKISFNQIVNELCVKGKHIFTAILSSLHTYVCRLAQVLKIVILIICLGANKNKNMSSFMSNENIRKKEDGSYYLVSANKASSVSL